MKNCVRDLGTYAIIGAAMEVHRILGHGILEAVYQEALAIELEIKNISLEREVVLPVNYRGRKLKTRYRYDFLCYQEMLVETKEISKLGGSDEAKIINYLKAMQLPVGLLLNFGTPTLE